MAGSTILLNMPTPPIIRERQYDFRDFSSPTVPQHVKDTYNNMHTYQTLNYVQNQIEKWGRLDKTTMTIMEAIDMLSGYIDTSDPDINIGNAYHGYQTAEGIRAAHPDNEWFQVVGFMHDAGKVMGVWGEPSWAVVGDTYPVGCAPVEEISFGRRSFSENPDMRMDKMNSKLGIYEENCGLDNVTMSWGHDEYLYRVLCGNKHSLPAEALNIIRYHSFYSWHQADQYMYLCSEKDRRILPLIKEFQTFDLYTKTDSCPDVETLRPYYESLIDKYIPGKLRW